MCAKRGCYHTPLLDLPPRSRSLFRFKGNALNLKSDNKMNATSIHIEPAKVSADRHNRRLKALDYVRKDLSKKNQHWQLSSYKGVADEIANARTAYKKSKGKNMHSKATPVREGVAVISESTTIEDLKRFADECEKRWGIKALSITTHKDEGHEVEGVWKPNLHAHIIWRWCDEQGITRKLNRQDMADMQTLLADCLQMERGQSSDLKHLNAVQYKAQQEEERASKLEEQSSQLNKAIRDAGAKLYAKQMALEDEQERKTISDLLQTMGEVADTIANYLTRQVGDLWRRYKEQWDRWYKGHIVTELDKIGVWFGRAVTDRQLGETYTADRSAGNLLVNGVSVPEIERRQRQIQRVSYPTDKVARRLRLDEGERIALAHYQPIAVGDMWVQVGADGKPRQYKVYPGNIIDETTELAQDMAEALSDALRQANVADYNKYILIKPREHTARQETQRRYEQQEEQTHKRGRRM